MKNQMKLAYLAAVLNAVIVGLSFLFTKVALEYANPLDTLMNRFAASFIIMSIPVAFGWIKLTYRGKPLAKVLLLATMYPIGFFTLQAFGLQSATSSEGGIVFAITPVLTILLAFVFLKETTTVMQKLSIFLSVFGVMFIFIMKGSRLDLSNLTGLSLLFLSCLALAGYSVLAKSLLRTFNPMEITYLMLGIGFITFLIGSVSNHLTAGTIDLLVKPLTNGTFLLSIFYLGVFSSLITALLSNYSLSKLEASKTSVFSNLSTIVSIAAGALFLGEQITIYSIIGSLLIITGVMGTNRFGAKRNKAVNVQAGQVEA
ncbi:DMT family transporter [Paenibacillus andongensis]|uniref:DMT family transporter n=1 Tax=Paenibacillus andongensis TaxID=2975482 RepID=UPI003F5A061A